MGWTGPMTWRQFTAWQAWLDEEWNRPSRSDNYMMQVSYDIRRTNAKKGVKIAFEETKIKFKVARSRPKGKLTSEELSALSMARCIQLSKMPIEGLPDKYKVPSERNRTRTDGRPDHR